MTSTITGQSAEAVVAQKLQKIGYKILFRNWKTAVCEIDIVAKKDDTVYFAEVKYRSGAAQGSGLDYIGPAKLRKMVFAARVWVQAHGWDGDWRLMAADVSGVDFENINLTEVSAE